MKSIIPALCFLFVLTAAKADPGVGIVTDSKGNVFYTDLVNVWLLKPDGIKTIAVPNVHTHELYMSPNDELFGEHLWYNGEQLNTWGHYLWKRNPDGSVIKIKDSTAGFAEESFVRDIVGNKYWVEKDIPSKFWMLEISGKKILLGQASLSSIGRLHISPKGSLYFSNKDDLYCIPSGDTLQLFVKSISEQVMTDLPGNGTHYIMSIWSDNKDNVYAATGNVIVQITKKKLTNIIYKSTGDWKPSGGLITPKGDFYVLEYNSKNEVRVNKISAAERKQIVKDHAFEVYLIPLLIISGILVFLYFLFRKKPVKYT
ncbi:hypothetical protein PDL71_10505 [Lacibacter sp. MH-610]|uniref:hypothetical protein n=1 Tax=Lacibacter sp. MH-610 TaxID=3020883 RepID=UPI0038912C7B